MFLDTYYISILPHIRALLLNKYICCLALAFALVARALVAGRHGHEGAGRVLDEAARHVADLQDPMAHLRAEEQVPECMKKL